MTVSRTEDGLRAVEAHSGVVLAGEDAALIHHAVYAERWERRDALLAFVRLDTGDSFPEAAVEDILARFGGADPDAALQEAVRLVNRARQAIGEGSYTVQLASALLPCGPSSLYSVLTEPEGAASHAQHFSTSEARRADLRDRAEKLARTPLDGASAEHCAEVIRLQGARVDLFEAQVDATGQSWRTAA